jgi:uncharacterized membrane protein
MSLPTTQPIFDDHERPTTPTPGSQTSSGLPPIRRRRGRRPLVPEGAGPRLALLERLAYRITPSLDFYLILLVSGIVLGAALLFNSPALMVLAALLAPFVAPPISLCLAAVLGSGRHFLYTLLSGLVGYILILLCGLLAGLASSSIPQPDYAAVSQAAEASWPGFVLVSAGTILTILSLIRTEQKPLVPSVALAYALYLPVGAAGFGLTSGIPGLWPQGLLTSVTYLVWAVLLGAIVLSVLGFWPRSIFGVVFEAAISLASLTGIIAAYFLPKTPPLAQNQKPEDSPSTPAGVMH